MKIISLHFRNLNSLKGEFKIDFTTPALANAGLFAITGPTGAGKSTILDAITLALYSLTPRLGSVNKTTITDKGVVVTKHTKDAFAHIIFEVNNIRYKAEWGVAINKSGNWNNVTHKFSIEEGGEFVPKTQNTSATVAMINKVVGLDEGQFTKAIVLSQGKFDEFLTAKGPVRYKLLEIITGTDIYRQIGKKVFEALRLKNDEVKILDAQLSGISCLTLEEITAYEHSIVILNNEIQVLKEDIIKLNKLKQTKEHIVNLRNQKNDIDTGFINLQERADAFNPYLLKLDDHEKALPLQVDFNKWENADADIKRLDKLLINLNSTLGQQQVIKETLMNELSLRVNLAIDDTNFKSQLDTFANAILKVDEEIIKAEAALKQKGEGLNILYLQIPNANLGSIKPIAKSITELNNFVISTDAKLNISPLPENFDLNYFEVNIDALSDKAVAYRKLIELKEVEYRLTATKNSQLSTLDALKNTLKEQQKELNGLEIIIDDIINNLQIVQTAYDANLAYMSLDLHRTKLVAGKECPCCGSLEHPYVKTKPRIDNKLEEDLKKLKQTLDINENNAKLIRNELLSNTVKIESLDLSIKDIDTELSAKNNLFASSIVDLNMHPSVPLDQLLNLVNENEITLKNLKLHKSWNETKKPLLTYIDALAKYNEDDEKIKGLRIERANLFSGQSIVEFKDNNIVSWNNIIKDIDTTLGSITESNNKRTAKKQEFESLNTNLSLAIVNLNFDSIEKLKLVLLSDTNLDTYKKEKASIENTKVTLATRSDENIKQSNIAAEQDDLSINYDDLLIMINAKSLERDTSNNEIGRITTLINQNADNVARVAGIEARLQAVKIEQGYYKTMAELIGDKDGDKFNSIIQRITLRHLFNMTNQRLLKIMDRYQVDLGSEKSEDEIWVIDTYMGDERRVINSVSGGERFVISLAMALSLSDLASNNVKLDSVFIDEGFGSLSPDELNSAISMLERMQVENDKTIGIISHVESLKERISTQIVVEKLQNGESTIFLKSNGELTKLNV